ncbi:MAG TPA: hypothetical protein VG798_05845, partial [Rhizomicrobium sp.]|nr:hypothetical protein [Rhizomicrobium sp.]
MRFAPRRNAIIRLRRLRRKAGAPRPGAGLDGGRGAGQRSGPTPVFQEISVSAAADSAQVTVTLPDGKA